ncbi:class I SAM-dependent methyltransferase [Arcobacter sp. KX21116]|uniref:class I SAM-dependent methyltransferase n=1 Tax=Arcobacter iocasae TaxID=2906515 RepID=UPI0035D499D7
MENTENLDSCPWCESCENEKWGDPLRGFVTVKCKSCSLIFVKNRLNSKGLINYYSNYFSEIHQEDLSLNLLRKEMYIIEYNYVKDYFHKKLLKVLDVGCSGGFFLDEFSKDGHECFGVEFGEEAAREAKNKYKIYEGVFNELNIKEKFDLIVFRGVIEHIPYPKKYLEKAYELLNKDGLLYITSTPNSDAVSCELFKEKWNQHTPEEHLMHFNPNHFKNYLNKFDMKELNRKFLYEETPYSNIEDDILKVAEAIKMKRKNNKINFVSPAFYGNMMSLIYRK